MSVGRALVLHPDGNSQLDEMCTLSIERTGLGGGCTQVFVCRSDIGMAVLELLIRVRRLGHLHGVMSQ
jgi:hypothetical protein